MPAQPLRLFTVATAAIAAPVAASAALWWATPADMPRRPAGALHYLGSHSVDIDLTALLAIVAWATVCWLALGALVALAGHVPGLFGALARPLAARVAPAVVRRAVELAIGAGVVTTIALAQAPLAAATTSSVALSLDRPGAAPAATAAPAVDLDRPMASIPAASAPNTVVVTAGDTLWSIAARRLGPHATAAEIAAAWPRWHAANRAVIGPDPSVLRPGQHLVAPTS